MTQISEVFPWHYQLLFMVLEVRILADSWLNGHLINSSIAKCDPYLTIFHSSITIKPLPLPRTI